MHLIDFEQLKMENVTLREKIEERGDEVTRLRKKTNATVQARLAAFCQVLSVIIVNYEYLARPCAATLLLASC